MRTSAYLATLLLLVLLTASRAFAEEREVSYEQHVRDYVAAYNERNVDAMMAMVTDDVQWLSVLGEKLSVESRGKPKLREGMEAYFKALPSAKSELKWVRETSSRVAALEEATWQGKSGVRTQRSLSVYEFRDGLISRVYYYPPEN